MRPAAPISRIMVWAFACLFALTLAKAVAAIPPPPDRLTADCTAPSYASDQLVCGDPELQALDLAVARGVAAAENAGMAPGTVLVEAQGAWFRRRSLCAMQAAHRDCLAAAYRDRLAVLSAFTSPPLRASATWQCEIKRVGPVLLADHPPGLALLNPTSGQTIGYASQAAPATGWRPHLQFVRKGRKGRLLDASGMVSPCHPSMPKR